MSIFGQLDAANIKTNPLFIEQGEYVAEVTKAEFRKRASDDARQLYFQYTITQEESKYNGKRASQFFTLVSSDMTAEMLAELPVDEQEKIEKSNSALKRTLSGTSGFANQKGLGLAEEDLNNPEWTPESLIGTKIILTISNYGIDGVNVRSVNIIEE
jgi:hypothetical protein